MTLRRRLCFYPRPDPKDYIPLKVGEKILGWVKPEFAHHLLAGEKALVWHQKAIMFAEGLSDPKSRSQEIARLLERKRALIPGWRNELFAVVGAFGESPAFFIERAATPLFGILAFAVNLVGYVKKPDGFYFWLGRRSMQKQLAPGALDVLTGGGLPAHMTVKDNLYKEAWEEAGIPLSLAERAEPIGHISFALETEIGLRREYQFNFALELPKDFRPEPQDGEVSEFSLMHQDELLMRLQGGEPILIDAAFAFADFLIRWKIIGQHFPDFASIPSLLRQPADL